MRYGLRAPDIDCTECPDRKRRLRNCHNWQRRRETIVHKRDWMSWPESLKHVEKYGDLKLFECPLTAITQRTWEIIRTVNETTNVEGDVLLLPYQGAWFDQPEWYRQAVGIIKKERAEHRHKELEKQTQAAKSKHGKR